MPPLRKNSSASCLVAAPFDSTTLEDAARGCRERLGGIPDLVVAFVSSDYRRDLPTLIETLQIDGHATQIVGCSASGLRGVGKEHENACGISLLFQAFETPDFSIVGNDTDLLRNASVGDTPSGMLLLGNPLRTDLTDLIASLNSRAPDLPLAGGFATGGPEESDVFLFTQNGIAESGSVAVIFHSGISLTPLVSQGCRPIGDPLVVTGTSQNELVSIGRKKAFTVLEETFEGLPEELQSNAAGSIFAGLAIKEDVEEFETGHFLIRHITGADLEKGRLRLATTPRVGQTIQFQLRDAHSAEASLREACTQTKELRGRPFAAILCSGQGRGKQLFEAEDRDIQIFEEAMGQIPVAGLFTNGELAPVCGTVFRHDHSFCGLLFYEADSES